QIREDLHADSIIPIRSWNNVVIGGTYRQEMALHFDNARYHKRQLVENRFSVLKRKFGGDLKARIFAIQKKEMSAKMIVCNIHRFLQFLVIEVFYRAKIPTFPSVSPQSPVSISEPLRASSARFLADEKNNGSYQSRAVARSSLARPKYLGITK